MLSLSLSLLLVAVRAFALDPDTARVAAENFLHHIGSEKAIVASEVLSGNRLDPTAPAVTIGYLYRLSGNGYLLIAADTSLTPVKAYSLTADFDTLPPPYREHLLSEAEVRIRALPTSPVSLQSDELTETERRWDFLLHPERYRVPAAYTPGEWLLSTQWNQNAPYNKFLPDIDGVPVLAGCVNVAMAQVMRYHGHPSRGAGVSSFIWKGRLLKTILFRDIAWNRMPNLLGAGTPEPQVDEVALLLRDLGIVNHTGFGTSSSGTAAQIPAWIEHFGYANTIRTTDNSTDTAAFFETLRSEIDAERPVLLSFPGHMGVADGYVDDAVGKTIHINMGWGGHHDDFYFLDDTITPSPDDGAFSFDPSLTMVYGIEPCTGSTCHADREAEDGRNGSTITGRFDYDTDIDRYTVFLKGPTTLTGSRGYSNWAFFVSVYDVNNECVASNADFTTTGDPLTATLPAGRYELRISLHGEDGRKYANDPGHEAYTVDLSTSELTPEERNTADAAVDGPPIIRNAFSDRILASGSVDPVQVLLDVRDPNDDPIQLRIFNANPTAVTHSLQDGILSLSPAGGAVDVASRILVEATAGGKAARTSFVVMVAYEEIGFGTHFEVSGLFEDQADFNTHQVLLDGGCTIVGYNRGSQQAFFSSVLDSDQAFLVEPVSEAISDTFAPGIYALGASLRYVQDGVTSYYEYAPGENDRYRLVVRCPQADDSVKTTAARLGIDLAGAPFAGDLNNDGRIGLADAITGLQMLSGMEVQMTLPRFRDADGDGRIGMETVLDVLRDVAR